MKKSPSIPHPRVPAFLILAAATGIASTRPQGVDIIAPTPIPESACMFKLECCEEVVEVRLLSPCSSYYLTYMYQRQLLKSNSPVISPILAAGGIILPPTETVPIGVGCSDLVSFRLSVTLISLRKYD